MADVARLGIQIDGTQIVEAKKDLDSFTESAGRAEKSARSYQRAMNERLDTNDIARAADDYDKLNDSIDQAHTKALRWNSFIDSGTRSMDRMHAEALKLNSEFDRQAAGTKRSTDGIGRLNNSMIVLTRQLTGAHPIVGQLTDAVGTFAIGTGPMVGVLAGLAAIAGGISLITRESREAKQELKDVLERLDKLAAERDIEAGGGQTAVDVRAIHAEIARLEEQERRLREVAASARLDPEVEFRTILAGIRAKQQELFSDLQPGQAELDEGSLTDRIRLLNREADRERSSIESRLDASRVAEATKRALTSVTFEHEERLRRESVERDEAAARARTDAIEEHLGREIAAAEEAAAKRERIRQKNHDDELRRIKEEERARKRALDQFASALIDVGRAYGGPFGELAAIAGSTIGLGRLPGFGTNADGTPQTATGHDRLVGYGSAALAGIGIGSSTGNAGLGFAGGAASGFALAGPTGMIVGGVTGIVSGLLEQGARAEAARRLWERSLEAYAEMFEEFTPLESDLKRINDGFDQMMEGLIAGLNSFNIEETLAKAAELQRIQDQLTEQAIERARIEERLAKEDLDVRFLRAQGLDEEAGALALQRDHERELREYRERGWDTEWLKEVQAQERINQARRDELDAINSITTALNSPQGLNLALLTWRASLTGGPVGGSIDGTPFLPGSGSGPATGPSSPGIGNLVVTINVNGATDSRETANMVLAEFSRIARTGGGSPLDNVVLR